MRIAMIGTGYVGLVSGACFADFGHRVTCVDKDADKIAALHRGEIPIFEPGLDALVASNVKAGRLDFTTDLAAPVAEADAVFIAVGTPSRRGDGHADLSYVYAAAREIAAVLSGFTVVVTKSTVPVGTGDEVERIIREVNPSADVVIASNPEFLREGAAIRDFKFPDRIVVGTTDERARKVLGDVYRPLSLNQAPLMFTERRTAELIKYAANAFLATKITFINDMREAPSIPLVTGLLDMGAKVRAHDPVGIEQARRELPDIEYCDDPYACARGADALVIVTEWAQFRALDLERLKRELAQPVVVD